jgi:hypothetical protein
MLLVESQQQVRHSSSHGLGCQTFDNEILFPDTPGKHTEQQRLQPVRCLDGLAELALRKLDRFRVLEGENADQTWLIRDDGRNAGAVAGANYRLVNVDAIFRRSEDSNAAGDDKIRRRIHIPLQDDRIASPVASSPPESGKRFEIVSS